LPAADFNNSISGNLTEVYDATLPTSEELHSNVTEYRVILNITEFRMDPNYSIYFNWTRNGSHFWPKNFSDKLFWTSLKRTKICW
jgi:hypothetical protein